MKEEKTNVMRVLERAKLDYRHYCYAGTGALSGGEVARALGQDPNRVFKTLVTVGKSGAHYVFLVPVLRERELKRAAASVGEKSVAMVKSKELLGLTGYIHGGCSPIGMKKLFVTRVDRTAERMETILFSAGKIGYQVELAPEALRKVVPFECAELTAE